MKAEALLNEMESLLDQLLVNAKKLLVLSRQVIEEAELIRLQQEQEVLLEKLIERDAEFQKIPGPKDEFQSKRGSIDGKIDQFQKMNADFLENVSAANGLIKFKHKE